MTEDYSNIENLTKAKLEEEYDRLEPIVRRIKRQLDKTSFWYIEVSIGGTTPNTLAMFRNHDYGGGI